MITTKTKIIVRGTPRGKYIWVEIVKASAKPVCVMLRTEQAVGLRDMLTKTIEAAPAPKAAP